MESFEEEHLCGDSPHFCIRLSGAGVGFGISDQERDDATKRGDGNSAFIKYVDERGIDPGCCSN